MVEKVRHLCKINGITIAKLEKDLGVGAKIFYKWDKSDPKMSSVKAVADYFNVSVDYICGRDEKEPISQLDQQFLVEYKKLTAESKEHLKQYMQFLANQQKEGK